MSEYIAHLAVFDDCARLTVHSPEICDPVKETLNKHWDIGRLACATRSGDMNTIHFFDFIRENWHKRKKGDQLDEIFAFNLGWRLHNAADRMFKPIYVYFNPEHYVDTINTPRVSDLRIFHDTILFREVYGDGTKEPFLPSFLDFRLDSHPAQKAVDIDFSENLFSAMWQRSLLEQHAFLDEDLDIDEKLKLLFDNTQELYVELNRYSDLYYRPDPHDLNRFIIESNFYDQSDPLIRLVRSIQDGKPDSAINLVDALQAADEQSQYARVLKWGYGYMKASSDYFESKINTETFSKLTDLGKPHRPQKMYDWFKKWEEENVK